MIRIQWSAALFCLTSIAASERVFATTISVVMPDRSDTSSAIVTIFRKVDTRVREKVAEGVPVEGKHGLFDVGKLPKAKSLEVQIEMGSASVTESFFPKANGEWATNYNFTPKEEVATYLKSGRWPVGYTVSSELSQAELVTVLVRDACGRCYVKTVSVTASRQCCEVCKPIIQIDHCHPCEWNGLPIPATSNR